MGESDKIFLPNYIVKEELYSMEYSEKGVSQMTYFLPIIFFGRKYIDFINQRNRHK